MQDDLCLTKKEIATLVKILPKLKWPLPYSVFVALGKSVPLIAIDLAVMPDPKHILLTYRKDEFYDNWHIPGMILRHKESVFDRLRNVARDELCIRIKNIKFVGFFEYHEVRNHAIGLLFVARPIGIPCDGQYFDTKRPPKNFLSSQLPAIKLLRNFSKKF